MKRILASAVAVCLLLGLAPSAEAQVAGKPVVVVSLSGYTKLKDSILYLVKSVDMANQVQIAQVQGMADALTNGLDVGKPWGAVVSFDGTEPQFVAFVPVKNLNQFLGGLALFGVQAQDAGNGLKSIRNGIAFVKEQDGYAFVAQKAEQLQNLPDPAKVLGTLAKDFDFAIGVNAQNVPLDLKTQFVSLIRMSVEQQLEQRDGESNAQFGLRKNMSQQTIKSVEQMLNEMDQLTLGWQTDQKTKKTYLDITVTASRGTRMAKSFAKLKDATTKFGGVIKPDAPFSVHTASEVTDQQEIDQAVAQLRTFKQSILDAIDDSEDIDTDEQRDLLKGWASQAMDVMQRTVEAGRFDMAASFNSTAGGPATFIAGLHVADGKALEKIAQDVLKMAEKEADDFPKVQYNAGTYKGTTLHSMAIEPPDNKEEFRKIFGDKPMAFLGFSTDTVWVALGDKAEETIKAGIDGTGERKAVKPGSMSASIGAIMKLAAHVNTEDADLQQAANSVAAGTDHVRMVVDPIENGERIRIEVEESVLKLIGVLGKAAEKKAKDE